MRSGYYHYVDDAFSLLNDETPVSNVREKAPISAQYKKLRHPGLLTDAKKQAPGQAGKSASVGVNLFLAFNWV